MMDFGGKVQSGQLLHHAVRRGAPDRIDVTKYILHHGAAVDEVMYQHDVGSYLQMKAFGLGTTLHEAAKLGSTDTVELLATYNANPLIADSLGMLPLQVAEILQHHRAADALHKLAQEAKPPTYQFTAVMRVQDPYE